MLLVIDVGNTQTAIGVYEGESLDRMWRVATNRDHTADELRVKLLPLLQSENLQASDITGAALASVVPQLTGAWTRAVQDLAGKWRSGCHRRRVPMRPCCPRCVWGMPGQMIWCAITG